MEGAESEHGDVSCAKNVHDVWKELEGMRGIEGKLGATRKSKPRFIGRD